MIDSSLIWEVEMPSTLSKYQSDRTCKNEISRHSKNRFKLLSKIARTKMSSVYLAIDRESSKRVILKFLANSHCKNSKMRKRFNREANLGKRVNHPNVVQIRAKGLIKKRPFILIDYIEGRTLEDVAQEGLISPETCIKYLIEAAKGLDAIHSAGLVHRDIKPTNMMIENGGRLQITDLGLMTQYGTVVEKLTATDALMLSPLFASPEQARGQTIDWRSDIYSLGATFYYLATGVHPFVGQSPVDTLLMHISATLVPPSAHNPQLPDEFCSIIEKMLSKNPRERHSNCKELIAELEPLRAQYSQSSRMSFSFKKPQKTRNFDSLVQAFLISLALVATLAFVRLL